MLDDLRRQRRTGARLLGIGVSNLHDGPSPRQMVLFDGGEPRETDQDRALNRAVDGLRNRFGRDAVLPGGIVEPPPDDGGGEMR
jgi:hypothetical protein